MLLSVPFEDLIYMFIIYPAIAVIIGVVVLAFCLGKHLGEFKKTKK